MKRSQLDHLHNRYVLLVHCALIADMTTNNHERNNLNLMRTFAGITGSGISSVSYLFWNKEDLSNFRMFCIMIAFIASCGKILCAGVV